jgi:hypothetical protein
MAGVTFATAASPSPRRCRRFSRASVWGFASAARPRRRQRTGKGASPRGPRPPTGHRDSLAKRSRRPLESLLLSAPCQLARRDARGDGFRFSWKSATAEFTNPTGVESPDDQPHRKDPEVVEDREAALTDLRPQAEYDVLKWPCTQAPARARNPVGCINSVRQAESASLQGESISRTASAETLI